MESTEAEEGRERRIMQNETRPRGLSDSIKCSNIHVIGIPIEEEREKG